MECRSIKGILAGLPDIGKARFSAAPVRPEGFLRTLKGHFRFFAAAKVDSSVGVAVNNLAWDEEVVLAESLGALPHRGAEVPLRVDCDLHALVHPEAVNIQSSDHHTREVLDFCAHRRLPFAETVLYACKFGELLSPFRDVVKCAEVAILVEVGLAASNHACSVVVMDTVASWVPEPWVRHITFLQVFVANIPVNILALTLP